MFIDIRKNVVKTNNERNDFIGKILKDPLNIYGVNVTRMKTGIQYSNFSIFSLSVNIY